ncbi:MAG: serine/threonine protein kinase [Planctomycetes bacterium]|nr:serine/threonine protein kinase [Planctomycetota bacterium]
MIRSEPPHVVEPTPLVNPEKKLELCCTEPQPVSSDRGLRIGFFGLVIAAVIFAFFIVRVPWLYLIKAFSLLGAYAYFTRWIAVRAREPKPGKLVQFLERVRRAIAYESPPKKLVPGEFVPGAKLWVLEEKIGAGGFGEVWRARNTASGELRAVKFCTHSVARERLFAHESKVALHVRKHTNTAGGGHPNIVQLLDYSLSTDPPWLMYEIVEGGRTLENMIPELAAVPVADRLRRTVALMRAVAGAIGQFHRIDVPIVHRDLKPTNVLLDGDVPRITDFGIGGAAVTAPPNAPERGSVPTLDVPSLLRISGTPSHASPQQARGEPPDPRDDVYALGVMTYQLLIGRNGVKVQGNWYKRLKDIGVPDPIIDLIGDSTSEEPADRPKDAAEWAAMLPAL